MNYPYDDGFRQKKIEAAIAEDLIVKSVDPDGVVRYTVTDKGMRVSAFMHLQNKMQRDFDIIFGKGFRT